MIKKGMVVFILLILITVAYLVRSQGSCGNGVCEQGETCLEDMCCDGDTYVNGYICCDDRVYFGNCCEDSDCLLDSCDYHRCVTCIEDEHCPYCYECTSPGTRQSYCFRLSVCETCIDFSSVVDVVNRWIGFQNTTQQVVETVKGWKNGC